ncbi:MFS transporter [Salmonella enterica]|nr:MFS transporter [Salmonella enterica]EJA5054410.1 MFS transporter [Salmonella enterica]EJA5151332.1 MFS transporter [Salmonella enterica]EJA5821108.1 MFS transporter [Salmonella enterica]EJA5857409.1 MFS transporter [Salmonella enterica]
MQAQHNTSQQIPDSPWLKIGGSLLIGMFVSYLDRTNLSVALPELSKDLGFAGANFAEVSSWALTTFLIGYTIANILGGLFTRKADPKRVAIWCVTLWSIATLIVGFTNSIWILLLCRVILGITEGIYWPQQSRFARAWFSPQQRTRANSLVQFYGQYLALALGFIILTPFYDTFGWRILFFITGGLGLVVIVPLYLKNLRPEAEAPYKDENIVSASTEKLTLVSFGGSPFFLLIFTYIAQSMLFWGITLWIPLVVRSIGFTGFSQAIASAVPYLAAVLLAIPIAKISDKTNKRVLIASLGLLIPGCLIITLPLIEGGVLKIALITVAMGYYASSFSPNIWSLIQGSVAPHATGSAAGIINGVGSGGGGTIAGLLVGMMYMKTGSYLAGFVVIGIIVVCGAVSLMLWGRLQKTSISVESVKVV